MDKIKHFLKRIVSYITPGYVAMLFAAFVLWYITKLGESYTTEHEVVVVVDGKEYDVDCTVHGKGTNLIFYTFIDKNSRFSIPSSELSLEKVVDDVEGTTRSQFTNASLQQALRTRMDDVEVVSVNKSEPIVILEE